MMWFFAPPPLSALFARVARLLGWLALGVGAPFLAVETLRNRGVAWGEPIQSGAELTLFGVPGGLLSSLILTSTGGLFMALGYAMTWANQYLSRADDRRVAEAQRQREAEGKPKDTPAWWKWTLDEGGEEAALEAQKAFVDRQASLWRPPVQAAVVVLMLALARFHDVTFAVDLDVWGLRISGVDQDESRTLMLWAGWLMSFRTAYLVWAILIASQLEMIRMLIGGLKQPLTAPSYLWEIPRAFLPFVVIGLAALMWLTAVIYA